MLLTFILELDNVEIGNQIKWRNEVQHVGWFLQNEMMKYTFILL